MKTLKRFFDDINRIANCLAFPRAQDVLVELCQKDRDLLTEAATKFRRNGPRVKKDAIEKAA